MTREYFFGFDVIEKYVRQRPLPSAKPFVRLAHLNLTRLRAVVDPDGLEPLNEPCAEAQRHDDEQPTREDPETRDSDMGQEPPAYDRTDKGAHRRQRDELD